MKLRIDEYTDLSSLLHRWEPRCKLIGLVVLIFAFSFVRDLRMLLAMVVVTVTIYVISKLPHFPSYYTSHLSNLLCILPWIYDLPRYG